MHICELDCMAIVAGIPLGKVLIEVEMDFNEIASGHDGGPVRLVLVWF